MRRCPKCNRVYTNDAQKFCTQDGTSLVMDEAPLSPTSETVRIDSAKLNSQPFDDEATKVISRNAENAASFDPYKTVIATPQEKIVDPYKTIVSAPHTKTSDLPGDTAGIRPQPSGPIAGADTSANTPPPQPPPPASKSGSVDLSATMASVPTMHLASGPISASLPSQPLAAAPPAAPPVTSAPPPAAPRKKSKLPLILGILAFLFVLGIAAVGALYWFVARPMLAKRNVVVAEQPRPEQPQPPVTENTPVNTNGVDKKPEVKEVPVYRPPDDAERFVNSKENLDGKLAEHYVDFSFYYPEGWQKDPTAGVAGASNFAKVERRLPPDFTQENFAVGWYSTAGGDPTDQTVFRKLAENLSGQFARKFAEYKKVSEGATTVGPYDGYEFRSESISRNTNKGDVNIWGRVVFLPPPDGGPNGVTLLMLTTSLAPELKSVDDVGTKGELPMLLESFRFGE